MRFILAIACLFPFTAMGADNLDAIRARGVLRVATTGDYQPFTTRAPGRDLLRGGHHNGATARR